MYIFLDTETTGLMPDLHEIIEVALITTDSRFNVTGTHVYKIKPHNLSGADADALAINGYNDAEWADALDPFEVAHAVREILDIHKRSILVAHNHIFDLNFLQQLFRRNMIDEQMYNPIIDTRGVALETFKPFGLTSTSMNKICFFLQWHKPQHRALSDAELCIRIMKASKRSYLNNALRLLISRICDTLGVDYSCV